MEKSNYKISKSVDEYLSKVAEPAKSSLEKLRKIIKETAPNAEEVISYGMPAFKQSGILVYYAVFKGHCSLFPGASIVKVFQEELKNYKTSKGTIQFTVEKPLPASLVKKIIKLKIRENEERKKRKK